MQHGMDTFRLDDSFVTQGRCLLDTLQVIDNVYEFGG